MAKPDPQQNPNQNPPPPAGEQSPPPDLNPPPADQPPPAELKKDRVQARVLVDHPHDGRILACGTVETFDAETAAALKAHGVIDPHPDAVEAGLAHGRKP